MKASISLKVAAAAAVSLILTSLQASAQGPLYTFTFLGALPGASDSFASGISESGDVAGASGPHAFLYHQGQLLDLGTLGGFFSFATALNDSGRVVGLSQPSGTFVPHAFLSVGGQMTDLGTLGGPFSAANGISQSGHLVVGDSATSLGSSHAFQYRGGQLQDLGTLGGDFSSATGVNDSGKVVGASNLVAGSFFPHAFLISGSQMTDINPGIPGGIFSNATAINQNGRVAVYEFNAQRAPLPFTYQRGQFTPIKLPSGDGYAIPFAINDSGTVVGISGDVHRPLRVFLSRGSMTLDLNTVLPGLCFCRLGINDNGQIAGSVFDQFSFVPHAVILTPTGGGGAQNLAATGPAVARSSSQVTWEKAAQLAGLK
jgi:probable HAF family extracellular repeat protein